MTVWAYGAFWIAMSVGFGVVNYFAVRHAVAAAIVLAAKQLGWTR